MLLLSASRICKVFRPSGTPNDNELKGFLLMLIITMLSISWVLFSDCISGLHHIRWWQRMGAQKHPCSYNQHWVGSMAAMVYRFIPWIKHSLGNLFFSIWMQTWSCLLFTFDSLPLFDASHDFIIVQANINQQPLSSNSSENNNHQHQHVITTDCEWL